MSLEQNRLIKNAYARKLHAEKRQLILEQRAQYNEQHKDEIAEAKKQKELLNKELNKKRCKEFRETHKEEIKAIKKQHYEHNKDNILDKQKEIIKCDVCGCESTKHNLPRHKRGNRCKPLDKQFM